PPPRRPDQRLAKTFPQRTCRVGVNLQANRLLRRLDGRQQRRKDFLPGAQPLVIRIGDLGQHGDQSIRPASNLQPPLLAPAFWSAPVLAAPYTHLGCSADFQSAVSPICNRQGTASSSTSPRNRRLAECNSAIQ